MPIIQPKTGPDPPYHFAAEWKGNIYLVASVIKDHLQYTQVTITVQSDDGLHGYALGNIIGVTIHHEAGVPVAVAVQILFDRGFTPRGFGDAPGAIVAETGEALADARHPEFAGLEYRPAPTGSMP